jgi:hypothetical protein
MSWRVRNEFIVNGDLAWILVYNRKRLPRVVTVIDSIDVKTVQQHPITYAKTRQCVCHWNGERHVNLGALLLGLPQTLCVDHINGNPLDNRRCNLRAATRQNNNQNRHVTRGALPYKGVNAKTDQPRKNPFRAYIGVNGKQINLGHYPTPEAAALAYNEAAKKHFGEFAWLNKIPATKKP